MVLEHGLFYIDGMKILMNFAKSLSLVACLTVCSLAEEPVALDSAKTAELLEEIAIRDSVMALHDSSCAAEKDSLRFAMKMESSMCESWKQSYDTMKKNYGECNQALRTAKEENENKINEAEKSNSSSVIVPTSTFLGGLGIGMLLFWLFF